mgnify:CR=1 FL=1
MPTFSNPVEDAAEARESVRALAHASRAFADPADTYQVVGELLGTLRSLQQVLEQLGATHVRHQESAFLDNGDRSGGLMEADAAARTLRRASALVGQAERAVDEASQHSGRIAWHLAPTLDGPGTDPFARDPFDPHPVALRRGLSL